MRTMRDYIPDFTIALLLLLLPLLFFFPQTLGGKTLIPAENLYQHEPYATYREVIRAPHIPQNHLVADLILENYQWKSFIRSQIEVGEVPLWNPHQFSGIPFLAAGQHSALYPLSIVYYTLPLWLAYGWFTVLNLWLAGIFMFIFARGLGVSRAGATLAGVIYQLGGFVLASVVFQMMIGALPWVPLMMLMAEYILREEPLFGRKTSIPWVVIGSGALGLNILAGHVEITLYTLMITGYYAGLRWLVDWWRIRDHQATLRKAGWLLGMVILGIGLAAIQFFPLVEFAQSNWRSERSDIETVLSYAHPKRDILQFAMPNFYGNPTHHQVFDLFNRSWRDDFGKQNHTDWGIKNYVEGALYLGILPLLLAGYALLDTILAFLKKRGTVHKDDPEPPYRIIFSSLALLSLTFMFGLPTYRLIYLLPGFNQLNSPFRWIFALTICVALLAAFGLDALLKEADEQAKRIKKWLGYGITLTAIMILCALGASYFAYPEIEATIQNALNSLALADRAFSDVQLFYSYQFTNAAIFAVMLLLSGVIFISLGRKQAKRTRFGFFAVGVVAVDLMIASWGFNPASDPELLKFTPPVVQWLQERYEEDGAFRYTTLEDGTTILNANSTMQYGLDDIRGYDSIIPKPYMDYMREIAPQVQRDYNRIAPLSVADTLNHSPGYQEIFRSPLFRLLNVRYLVTQRGINLPDEYFSAVYADEAVVVYEYDLAFPRAYLVENIRIFEAWQPASFVPEDIALEDTVPEYKRVPITHDSGREKFLEVSLSDEAWLVISENYSEGWKAFIRAEDETEETQLTVEQVAGIFQGVRVPEGDWTVRLVYSPRSVQIGFFGSAISTIALTLMLGMWLWVVFVGVNTEDSSQTAKVARNSIAPILLNLFNRGIDFVLAIVIYRLLAQEMVGVYNFAIVVFVWFDIFTNFGLDLFLIREVSREKTRSGYYLFNTSVLRLWLSMFGMGLLGAFLMLWQDLASEPLPIDGIIAIILLYIGLFPASLSKGMTSLYYAHEQAEKPAAIATITSINKAVLGVIVLLMGWGIVGLALVSIFNNFVTLGVLIRAGKDLFDRGFSKIPDRHLIRNMISESYPLLLNHFLATIFFQIDIIILQAIKGWAIVAQYSTSYKWLLAINIIPAFFTQALFPVMSRQASKDREAFRRTYIFGLKIMVLLSLPVAVGFTVLATPLTLILAGSQYLPNGAIALTIMIWSIPLGWMNSLTQYALVALNLQRHITRAFFAAVLFNIVTNTLLIPQYGFQAAAVTTIFSELVLLIPFAMLMQRGLQQRLNWFGVLWRPVTATVVMGIVIYFLLPIHMLVSLIAGSVAYLVVLLLLNPLDEEERAIIRPLLPQRLRGLFFLQ